jgi:anti-sigma factor RsiW
VAKACDYQKDLHSFLDGALDEQRRNEFEAHLVTCKKCSKSIEAASELKKLMRKPMPEDQMPEIWPSIKEKLPPMCVTVQADLSAYFDGELPSQAEAAIGSHVMKCSTCSGILEDIKTTGRLLAASFTVPAGTVIDLWPKLKPRLGEDCAMVAAELSAYFDAELDPLRHRAITAHLTDCSTCSVEFLRMSSLGDKLRSQYLPESDTPDLWAGINEKLKVVPFRRRSRYEELKNLVMLQPRRQRLALAAVTASVVVFSGICISAVVTVTQGGKVEQISAENYLLDSLLNNMSNSAEAVVYDDRG